MQTKNIHKIILEALRSEVFDRFEAIVSLLSEKAVHIERYRIRWGIDIKAKLDAMGIEFEMLHSYIDTQNQKTRAISELMVVKGDVVVEQTEAANGSTTVKLGCPQKEKKSATMQSLRDLINESGSRPDGTDGRFFGTYFNAQGDRLLYVMRVPLPLADAELNFGIVNTMLIGSIIHAMRSNDFRCTVIQGKAGTGKSSCAHFIVRGAEREAIIVRGTDRTMFDGREFTDFLLRNRDKVLIIEEGDDFFRSGEYGVPGGLLTLWSKFMRVLFICEKTETANDLEAAFLKPGLGKPISIHLGVLDEMQRQLFTERFGVDFPEGMDRVTLSQAYALAGITTPDYSLPSAQEDEHVF
jgi:hypothetical protein